MKEKKWYLRTQDETFGPESGEKLIEWARLGRIQPGQELSDDNVVWQRVEEVPFLDMRFSIDIGDGNPRGPFNKAAAEALLASGRLPPTASLVETREPFPEPEPAVVPQPGADVKVEERIVEKTVEKIVVDETRVKELEQQLETVRQRAAEQKSRLDEAEKREKTLADRAEAAESQAAKTAQDAAERETNLKAEIEASASRSRKFEEELSSAQRRLADLEASLKDAAAREEKHVEQIKSLEDEIRRLPQAASEVAEIQAAVYSIMHDEAAELEQVIRLEKEDFEAYKKRHLERSDRLIERRREVLKRSGSNLEEMTRRALRGRPEDPRTAQLRRELEELKRSSDRELVDCRATITELTKQLQLHKADEVRRAEGMKDIVQLRGEVQALREQLQSREKELMFERQRNEELRQQQAVRQQALLTRLATLESPSIGTPQTMATNQSREAKMVKLPSWMHFKR